MPHFPIPLSTVIFGLLLLAPSLSHAEEAKPTAPTEPTELAQSKPKAYAILVGNNAGGLGQSNLRYAEDDAARISEVLTELGGYELQPSSLLLSPSPMALWSRFETVHAALERDRQAGIESMLFFYYSGHARSSAIDLGPQQVALTDLRKRIEAMPANLRIVILDACQSGAISRVKGATPAVDFSSNSVSGLRMQGIAIMASSTGTELSQESDSLKGSYFTHHLVTGLRGVADKNQDGAVTLSEAYDYAYSSTLLATAVSAVGKQHVTLETDLQGKGDVALTRPAKADSKLLLPARLVGAITIAHTNSKSVVAEINKVAGQSNIVAFPAARYTLLVRENDTQALECELRLRPGSTTELKLANCSAVAIASGIEKGGAPSELRLSRPRHVRDVRPPWNIELSVGLRGRSDDAYTDRLETFGYDRADEFFDVNSHIALRAIRRVGPHLSLGASIGSVESESYRRHTDGASTYDLNWSASHLSALARIDQEFGRLQLFAEGELGLTRAESTLTESEMSRSASEVHYGYNAGAFAGLAAMPWRNFGFTMRVGYGISSTLENELGETRLAAGVVTSIGMRVAL